MLSKLKRHGKKSNVREGQERQEGQAQAGSRSILCLFSESLLFCGYKKIINGRDPACSFSSLPLPSSPQSLSLPPHVWNRYMTRKPHFCLNERGRPRSRSTAP